MDKCVGRQRLKCSIKLRHVISAHAQLRKQAHFFCTRRECSQILRISCQRVGWMWLKTEHSKPFAHPRRSTRSVEDSLMPNMYTIKFADGKYLWDLTDRGHPVDLVKQHVIPSSKTPSSGESASAL